MQNPSLFFLPLFFLAFFGFMLGILVILKRIARATIVFSFFTFAISFWTFGLAMFGVVDLQHAFFWNKEFILSAGFIAATFLHFIYAYGDERISWSKVGVIYFPSVIIGFLLIFRPEYFIKNIVLHDWGKESILGEYYLYFGLYYGTYTAFGFYKLLRKMLKLDGLEKERYKFILLATFLTSCFGAYFNLFLILIGNYRYVWVGPYCSLILVSVISYAIIKYRLMDIKIAVTRLGIFLSVYTLILGIPFWIGLKILGVGIWLIPVALMAFFATIGPYIYFYIQRRAEDRLLQEQRRYQATLRQASAGMGRIKDLKKLLNLIVYIVTRAVRIDQALIYVHNDNKNEYTLGAYKRRNAQINLVQSISDKTPFIDYLVQTSAPVVYGEIKQKALDYADENLRAVEKFMREVEGAIAFPILIEQRLLAIILLGKKDSGKLYTEDDLSVFSILSNQIALAIENAQFYEEMKKTHEQLFQAEKMATIGTMADGLSHQI